MAKLGRILNERWDVRAHHALYSEHGTWYMPLERFPGALFDANGYVVFRSIEEYNNSPHLNIGARVNVPDGISHIPGYVRVINDPDEKAKGAALEM